MEEPARLQLGLHSTRQIRQPACEGAGAPPPGTAAGSARLWAAAQHRAAQLAPRQPAASLPAQKQDAVALAAWSFGVTDNTSCMISAEPSLSASAAETAHLQDEAPQVRLQQLPCMCGTAELQACLQWPTAYIRLCCRLEER